MTPALSTLLNSVSTSSTYLSKSVSKIAM
jgi:hypothetical protein